jgi:hypothetical protein
MAATELTLPEDVPWKRMGVSEDMIFQEGELSNPDKWRSSIAVFYHEPTVLPPEYCNRKITYLKVACTITNYQWDGEAEPAAEDVSVLDQLYGDYRDFYAFQWFADDVTTSFPCYGALLQLIVLPSAKSVAKVDFPYVTAFQPRKREMYEAVTEAGEVASQSSNRVNILKGSTGTNTNEDYNLDLGGGGSGWGAPLGIGSQSTNASQQVGTIERTQNQNQNVTTTDASREKRESFGFQTSINQLYTLLQGYHLGTNRVIAFMQPRPHIQDTKFTFLRGLRRLEGIQEFFFIIDRPATIPGLCVQVSLETAHTAAYRAYVPKLIPWHELYTPENLNKTGDALGIDRTDPKYRDITDLQDAWNNAPLQSRAIANDYIDTHQPLVDNSIYPLLQVLSYLPNIGLEPVALIFEEYESDEGSFVVIGRRLAACVTPEPTKTDKGAPVDTEKSDDKYVSTYEKYSVVFESRYSAAPVTSANSSRSAFSGVDTSLRLNAIADDVNQRLWSSLASVNRFPYGKLSFQETEFVMGKMAQLLRLLGTAGIEDKQLEDVEVLKELADKGLGKTIGAKAVLDLGRLSTAMVRQELGLNDREARKVRASALVAGLKALDPKTLDPKKLPPQVKPVNRILEALHFEFPKDTLTRLERSAGARRRGLD